MTNDRFFFEAREQGLLIGHSEIYGEAIANQYDYAHPEVRAWMLAYIGEMVNRYDVFGLELDFMRCAECFDYVSTNPGRKPVFPWVSAIFPADTPS